MNKKITIGIIVVLIAVIGASAYLLLNKKETSEVKEPEEQIRIEPTSKNENDSQDNSSKSLVVYFSVPETDDPNKEMTTEEENSAIIVDGKVLGNTEYVAMLIGDYTNSPIYRIEPKVPYTTNHTDLVNLAKEEQNKNTRPEIKTKISNFDEYDTIYVGYPIWWSDMPQIMYTFFELYDFTGKTVIPFSTHGGSGLAGTVNTIKGKLKDTTVETNAFTMSRNDMESAPEEVKSWLQKINRID